MTLTQHRRRAPRVARRLLALLAALLVLAACTRDAGGPPQPTAAEPTMQPDDVVDLTVYFRSGSGPSAFLVPVTREAGIDEDLPRRALQLLIAGPVREDGRDLAAPLPSSTRVRDLRVEDGTAHVDVSLDVISKAEEVNPSPAHEALALAAVAGTLTEFPAIERVRLSVEGQQDGWRAGVDVGGFWGGWGLPEVLIRDESVLSEPAGGEGVPDLATFVTEAQEVGAPTDDAIAITSVRIRNRTTYLRVVVELANVADPDIPAGVPPARAELVDGNIVLEIDGIADYDADFETGTRVELDDPAFEAVSADDTDHEGQVRIVVAPSAPRAFLLHELAGPTRIVLDVRKS